MYVQSCMFIFCHVHSVNCGTCVVAGNDPSLKWLNDEPDPRLLTLIKYTDSEGKDQTFDLIKRIQNDCKKLGTVLGIDRETLTAFYETNKPKPEVCEDILDEWLKRGEGDYEGTWDGLLRAMNDAGLGGVAEHLNMALTLHFR